MESRRHACRFPESESPAGFWENLVTGTDMVTENNRRWPVGLHGTPGRFGKLVEYHLFDAPFFAVHGKQAAVSRDTALQRLFPIDWHTYHQAFGLQCSNCFLNQPCKAALPAIEGNCSAGLATKIVHALIQMSAIISRAQ